MSTSIFLSRLFSKAQLSFVEMALPALAAFVLLCLPSCTRPTIGFCNVDEDCDFGQYCSQPAHQCQNGTVIRGVFSGGQVVPPTSSVTDGTFEMIVSDDLSSGTYTLDMTTPVTNATKMELFLGKVGAIGTVVRTLPLDPSGTMTLDPDTVTAMKIGAYYLQISSPTFPNGEARAQLYSDNPTDTMEIVNLHGVLSGLQVSPSNTSPATGHTDVTLDETTSSVNYSYTYTTLEGTVTGVHVHRGGFNVNGPHTFDLPATPALSSSGTLSRSDLLSQLTDPTLYIAQKHLWRILMKSGLTYLNIHSTMFVIGEIRAQLLPTAAIPFNVPLATANGMGAQGQGQFYLSADGTMLAYRLSHNVQSPTGAVIAKGPTSANPLTCAALSSSGGLDQSQGYCQLVPTPSGTQIDLQSLKQGLYFLVIQSTASPTGEISGKIVVPSG